MGAWSWRGSRALTGTGLSPRAPWDDRAILVGAHTGEEGRGRLPQRMIDPGAERTKVDGNITTFRPRSTVSYSEQGPMFTDGTSSAGEIDPILAAAPYGLIVLDDGGEVLELNPIAESMFGVERSVAVGRSVTELPAVTLRAEQWAGLIHGGTAAPPDLLGRPLGITALRRDREEFPVEVTISRVERPSPRLVLWIRDVSAQETATERLGQCEAMLAEAEKLAQIGSWDWNPRSGELRCSDNCFRLVGLEPGEVTPTPAYLLSRADPDEIGRVANFLEAVTTTGSFAPFECRILVDGGGARHLRATVASGNAATGRVIGFVEDVTERHRTARELATHVAVAEALAEWETFETGAEGLLRRLGEAMAFERGLLWVVLDGVLVPRVGWHEDPTVDLLAQVEHVRLAPGVGISGRAWTERSPVSASNLHERPGYEFREDAIRDGVRSRLSIPAVHQEEVLAVVSFGSKDEIELTERLFQTLTGLGYELGLFLTHHRAELGPFLLTARERDVLELATQGMTSNAIAQRLVIETSTVSTHLQHIYRKLGVPDRAAAVARALRQGLID